MPAKNGPARSYLREIADCLDIPIERFFCDDLGDGSDDDGEKLRLWLGLEAEAARLRPSDHTARTADDEET